MIRAFHVYRTRHNPRSRLLLVGSYSGFERYLAMLHALVARLGTPDVHFLGHVSNEELTALYDVADVFLCASEHEGFCVPLVEAFHKRVPVLAYAATAVPGDDGRRRRALRHQGSRRGRPRHRRRRSTTPGSRTPSSRRRMPRSPGCGRRTSRRRCSASSSGCCARPARPAPEVAFDFWAQFDQFERLEELRQYRPALYRALPPEPAPPDPAPRRP